MRRFRPARAEQPPWSGGSLMECRRCLHWPRRSQIPSNAFLVSGSLKELVCFSSWVALRPERNRSQKHPDFTWLNGSIRGGPHTINGLPNPRKPKKARQSNTIPHVFQRPMVLSSLIQTYRYCIGAATRAPVVLTTPLLRADPAVGRCPRSVSRKKR